MKKQDAADILNRLYVAAQKTRSNILEALVGDIAWPDVDPIIKGVLANLHPWLFSEPNMINLLHKIINNFDEHGGLEGIDFFNVIVLANRTLPLVLTYQLIAGEELPEPQAAWIVGWED